MVGEPTAETLGQDFWCLVQRASFALLVKDSDGFYIYANPAAEALMGYDSGQIIGRHMTEVCPADPRVVAMAFGHLKREGAWSGRFVLKRKDGELLDVACHALAHPALDGSISYIDVCYALDSTAQLTWLVERDSRTEFGALDLSLLQLMVEGLEDGQLALLFGVSEESIAERVGTVIRNLSAASRTEACVRAIKRALVL